MQFLLYFIDMWKGVKILFQAKILQNKTELETMQQQYLFLHQRKTP